MTSFQARPKPHTSGVNQTRGSPGAIPGSLELARPQVQFVGLGTLTPSYSPTTISSELHHAQLQK